ncbi:hypothetical protein JR065_20820 [Xanthomonas sp. AmX2]|uniref:P-loop NTPase fold protein n=1 Tax=Xanthomonas sp. TaxID=29446 RepID=UPI00197DABEF|nr:P-loop NTPase fold protein [Xanthomonas sp.]MBN6152777.1 hypothetical protein [Xanthomonas sp.]
MQQLDTYLQKPQPGYAILISGAWGVGKSYRWSRYASTVANRTPLTISAAGLETSEDLERALLQASINLKVPGAVAEMGSVLGKALLRVAKIEPDDITWKADLTRDRTVVCIDDIERFAGPFNVIFGFIVNLIDGSGVYCVLIADEERAGERFPDYGKYKERIVGKSVYLAPDLREFCENEIQGFTIPRVRQVLLEGLAQLLILIEQARVSNLRSVRLFLTELESLAKRLPEDALDGLFASALPSAMLFWTVALARDASSRRLAEKVFSSDQIGMALAMHDVAKQKGHEADDEISKLAELLAQLELTQAVHNWPASRAFINHMHGLDEVDYRALAAQFGLLPAEHYYDPLEIINRYASSSDEEIQGAIDQARAELHGDTVPRLSRVLNIYRSLYFLSTKGVFTELPDDWTTEVLDRLGGLLAVPQIVDCDDYEIWPSRYDENEKRVIEKCDELAEAVRQWIDTRGREEALSALFSGEGPIPEADSKPLFISAPPPEEFVEKLRAGGTKAVIRLNQIFRKRLRISNSPDLVGADRDYADALADYIDQNVPVVRPMSLLDAELREAILPMRQFVQQVDKALQRRA